MAVARDVSCLLVQYMAAFAESEGVRREELLAGLGHPIAYLNDRFGFVGFDLILLIERRLAERFPDDRDLFLRMGRSIAVNPGMGFARALIRSVSSPLQIYALIPSLLPRFFTPMLQVEFQRLGAEGARLHYQAREGIALSDAFLQTVQGQLERLPAFLGHPDAEVDLMRIGPGELEARLRIAAPASMLGWFQYLGRRGMTAIAGRFRSQAEMVAELAETNRLLLEKVDELTEARQQLTAAFTDLEQEAAERQRAEAEQRRLEAEVQDAQKLDSLGLLAGGIAHDFNNLLIGILSTAEYARSRLPEGSPTLVHLRRIESAGARAADLCRLMLAYAGKGRFEWSPVDLRALVLELGDLLDAARPKKVRLRYAFPADLPPVMGDPSQLRQIVINLVSNAVEALGDQAGAVSLSAEAREYAAGDLPRGPGREVLPAGRYVCLRVVDDGPGMDEATARRAFEPFYSTKFAGRGLGLPAVQGAVRSHRGALRLETAPGRGAAFEVILPVSEALASPRAVIEPPRVPAARGCGTVLVVDDERGVREVAQEILEAAGYAVLTARHGREALQVYDEHPGEIVSVLLDVTMPHLDGVETLRELRQRAPGLRVVLTSGYSPEEIAERCADLGPVSFVAKPYRMAPLLAALHPDGPAPAVGAGG
jgi:signal transduction histidine kinase/ActR/RegA family two-component response regulator